CDALCQGEVLSGLPHGDVDIRQLAFGARIAPGGCAARRCRGRPLPRLGEGRVHGVRPGIRVAPAVARHGLDTGGDEDVTLARLDRVDGQPGGLQTGRAVPRERAAGQVIVPEQGGPHPSQVEALLATGQATAQHEIVDLGRIELGDLVECGADHQYGKIVRTDVYERALTGPADGGAGRRDYYCFRHGVNLPRGARV